MNDGATVAAAPRRPLRRWLGALLHPVTPGMDGDSPRARLVPLALMLALLALQVKARYDWGFLPEAEWQGLHILIGLAMVFGILALFHGGGAIRRVSRRSWAMLAVAVGCFLVFWYFGRMDAWGRYFGAMLPAGGAWSPLYAFIYFALCATLFRLVLPFALARWAFGLRPRELGLSARKNPQGHAVPRVWVVYLLLLVGVLPFVWYAAQTPAFLGKYPLARAMISPEGGIPFEHFAVYQLAYFFIFLSGESFWRGFIAFGLERDLGLYGLVVMVVPYVTAHFGKPYPETMGAIAAGMVLGFLALKHRSVWFGVALHYAIALAMDLLSILHNGFVIYLE